MKLNHLSKVNEFVSFDIVFYFFACQDVVIPTLKIQGTTE